MCPLHFIDCGHVPTVVLIFEGEFDFDRIFEAGRESTEITTEEKTAAQAAGVPVH